MYAFETIYIHMTMYEGPSKSSVMNGFQCARRRYASLILCIHVCHSIIHPHVKFRRNRLEIKISIAIHSTSLSHLHWPIFEDEKEERGKSFIKSRFAL